MSLVALIFLVVAVILLGAAVGKPLGWIAMGLAVLGLVLQLAAGSVRIG